MIWFGIIIFLILAIFFGLLFPKLNIIIEYRGGKLKIIFKNPFFRYTLDDERLKRLHKRDRNKSKSKENNGSKSPAESQTADGFFAKIEKAKRQYNDVKEIIETVFDYAGHRIEFSDIYIRSMFGTGDAAGTGMLYGAIWTLVGNVYAFLHRFFNIEFPYVELVPLYNEKAFDIEAEGIIKIRTVHIINAAKRGLKVYIKHTQEKGAF